MKRMPASKRSLPLLASFAALLVACPGGAQAQGKLEARYAATLAGIPIGKGSWVIDIGDAHYTAAASGMTTGLVRMFTGGRASGAAQGTLSGGQSVVSNYSATITTSRRTDEIRVTVASGNVKDFRVDPPTEPDPRRIPVTEAERQGVLDPMTASLVPMPGVGEMRVPQACERSVAVFDGRLRYNLKFAFKRMENVVSEKGYSGAAVVCSVAFEPVAGFVPKRSAIHYLSEPHAMEVWLVPIAGTRVMVPYRAQIETPVGLGVIEAKQFVAVSSSNHVTKGAKTQ
jgi:hypothetical protein